MFWKAEQVKRSSCIFQNLVDCGFYCFNIGTFWKSIKNIKAILQHFLLSNLVTIYLITLYIWSYTTNYFQKYLTWLNRRSQILPWQIQYILRNEGSAAVFCTNILIALQLLVVSNLFNVICCCSQTSLSHAASWLQYSFSSVAGSKQWPTTANSQFCDLLSPSAISGRGYFWILGGWTKEGNIGTKFKIN